MKRARIPPHYSGPTALVLDVSAHQGQIDWPRVARSEPTLDGRAQGPVRGVVVRLTDGVQTRRDSPCDPMAVRSLTGAHGAGLPVAGYLYLRGWHPGAEQAEVALEAVRVAGVPVPWVAIDVERGAWRETHDEEDRATTSEVLSALRSAAEHVEACGMRVVIYTGAEWHWRIAQEGLAPPECRWPLWVPDYVPSAVGGAGPRLPVDAQGRGAPWPEWTMHQYSSEGRVAGIDAPVDLSRFRGGDEALAGWWATGCIGS